MTERRAQLSLTTIVNHYTHWLGEFQRALFFGGGLFSGKLQLPKPLEDITGFRQFAQYEKMPAFVQLRKLHNNLCGQAVKLYQAKKPFRKINEEEFALLWAHFEKLTTQLQKIEKTLSALENGILDPLTGLKIPGQMMAAIEAELEKKRVHGTDFVVALADVDQVNKINQAHSRDAGDFVLSEIAGRIGQDLRPYDEIYRLQDDKFLILLKQVTLDNALTVLERVRRKVAILPVSLPDGRDVDTSVSIGIGVPSVDVLAEEILDYAWRALAKAKEERHTQPRQVTIYPN